jgi:hypothetical protein
MAGILGAAIGVGGAVFGAYMNGRNQRDLARAQQEETRLKKERVTCQSFLACLDIYLMVAEEMAWAKPGARRSGSDVDQATTELTAHYWSAWTAFLSANATLQLAVGQDEIGQKARESAKKITDLAYNIDGRVWNLAHGGQRIANDYEDTKKKLEALRDPFIDAVQQLDGR